ncbi:MAG: tryptophan--tRNA ligase [Firmicutes bacterium]|nr:tryptophan--tRNA ligase [Bacillota bacterium]MCM1393348.1 tryptophan--tRNA ligase [[Eubacterium] siraeum]
MATIDNENAQRKKIILSGIQPTGTITLGNYLGAVKNWQKMQSDFDSIFFIADLHALTVRREPSEFRQTALNFFAQFLACGLDPDKAIMYFQSQVRQHAELAWILNCNTYVGEASRMTQFKDKSAKHADNVNMGLMDYPVLMAADILLFNSDLVPVGIDQKQHLELTRDIAIRFNNRYGETFKVPEGYIPTTGAKICSLQDPTAKMSKSDPDQNATISIIDDEATIVRRFKRAVTDSGNEIRMSEDKAGISNLITIYSAIENKPTDAVEREFAGQGYGTFKIAVGEAVAAKFKPIRESYLRYIADKDYILQIAKEGAEKAASLAERTLRKVKKKVGLLSF